VDYGTRINSLKSISLLNYVGFLALVLRKVLQRKLKEAGHGFSWAEIKQDLEALQLTMLDENGKRLAVRSQCLGTCGKIFQAVGVAIPPDIQQAMDMLAEGQDWTLSPAEKQAGYPESTPLDLEVASPAGFEPASPA
jgi:hypothetical protein